MTWASGSRPLVTARPTIVRRTARGGRFPCKPSRSSACRSPGLRAAETLRREGFDGRIVAIGAEPHLPYDRPPLSKELLAGESEPDDIVLRKQGVDDLDLDWRLGRRATALDLAARTVDARTTASASRSTASCIATGSTPRRLPEPARPRRRVHAAHARRRARAPRAARRGPEGRRDRRRLHRRRGRGDVPRARPRRDGARERCRSRWCAGSAPRSATVIAGRAPRPRRRPAHRRRTSRRSTATGASSASASATARRSTPTSWSSASASCPRPRWLEGSRAHARQRRGVRRDAARRARRRRRRRRRALAEPAVRRRGHAARALDERDRAGRARGAAPARRRRRATPFAPVPFVWSDQYDRKIQTVGMVVGRRATCTSRTARSTDRQFVALFGRDGRIVGALGFNRPRQVMQYRKLIAERGVVGRRARRTPTVSERSQPRASVAPDARGSCSSSRAGSRYFLALGDAHAGAPALRRGPARHGSDRGRHRGRRVRGRRDRCCARSPGGSATRCGRRVLIIGGALVVAVVDRVLRPRARALVAGRVARSSPGFGEAAFFVGAATMITDLSPADRRGEAVSYWSVAVYGGLVVRARARSSCCAATTATRWRGSCRPALALVAALLGLVHASRSHATIARAAARSSVNRAALGPGTVLFLGLIPLAGFTAFMPLYADDQLGIASGPIFLLYGVLILGVRIFGARLPDRSAGVDAGTLALVLAAVGIGLIAAWPTVAGLVSARSSSRSACRSCTRRCCCSRSTACTDADRASVVGDVLVVLRSRRRASARSSAARSSRSTGNRGAFATGAVAARRSGSCCCAPRRRSATRRAGRDPVAPCASDRLRRPSATTHAGP